VRVETRPVPPGFRCWHAHRLAPGSGRGHASDGKFSEDASDHRLRNAERKIPSGSPSAWIANTDYARLIDEHSPDCAGVKLLRCGDFFRCEDWFVCEILRIWHISKMPAKTCILNAD
jgi:hypothetical protein